MLVAHKTIDLSSKFGIIPPIAFGRGCYSVNAVLAVVLPDENDSYKCFLVTYVCGCRTLEIESLFQIFRDNMFNRKNPETKACSPHGTVHLRGCSYIG